MIQAQDLMDKRSQSYHDKIRQRCTRDVRPEQFYQSMWELGYEYGPYFRLLRSLRCNCNGEASATVRLNDWATRLDARNFEPCLIHPTTLDTLLQLSLVAKTDGGLSPIPLQAAGATRDLVISSSLLRDTPDLEMSLHAQLTSDSLKGSHFDIAAFHAKTGAPLIYVSEHGGAVISDDSSEKLPSSNPATIAFNMSFRPWLSVMSLDQQRQHFARSLKPLGAAAAIDVEDIEALSFYYYTAFKASNRYKVPPAQKHLASWLTAMDALCISSPIPERKRITETHLERHMTDSGTWSAKKRAMISVGSRLQHIFDDKVTALELLFESDLANNFYAEALSPPCQKVSQYLDSLAHEFPDLKIIEVGAGTGGATRYFLETLSYSIDSTLDVARFAEYAFTDVSAAFLEPAKKKYSHFGDRMVYKVLDISKPPNGQGIQEGSYDVLVAVAVLHATPRLDQTLANCHKLLKPGGRLILIEPCNLDRLNSSFLFGLLPGWWVSQDSFRVNTPVVSEAKWHELLQSSGFSGVDLALRDFDDAEHSNVTAMISTVPISRERVDSCFTSIRILAQEDSDYDEVANAVLQAVKSDGWEDCQVIHISDSPIDHPETTLLISLVDLDRDILSDMDSSDFAYLKMILTTCKRVVWVTEGASVSISSPMAAKFQGLARVASSERAEEAVATLSLSTDFTASNVASLLLQIISHIRLEDSTLEAEFFEHDGHLEIGRVAPDAHFNSVYSEAAITKRVSVFDTDQQAKPRIALTIRTPGLLDTLLYSEIPAKSPLRDDEVEVEVKASFLNFRDVLVALGSVPGQSLGFDASGIVVRAWSASSYKPGDRIMCATEGAFGTFLTCGPTGMAHSGLALFSSGGSTALCSRNSLVFRHQGCQNDTRRDHSDSCRSWRRWIIRYSGCQLCRCWAYICHGWII